MAVAGVLLAAGAVLFSVFYFYVKYCHSYWAKRGVKHDKPNLFFGNLADIFATKESLFGFINNQYFKYPKEKIIGFYAFTTPMVIIRDLNLIKDVCIKDFNIFVNRSFHPDIKGDPLGSELMFGTWDDDWRELRHKSATAFTTGKMKSMYPLLSKVGEDLNKLCAGAATKGKTEVNIRNFCNRYAVDVITSCAFGSEAGAISKPEHSVLLKVLGEIFNFNVREGIASNLMFLQQRSIYGFLSRLGLGFKIFRKEIEDGIYNIVDIASKQRLQSGERRGDIFDEIVFSTAPQFQGLKKKAGAAFQMLLAGSETSSTTIVFTLYELAKHPEIQKKLQKEIRDELKKHNGEMPYDVLNNMEYLDQIIKETLRLHPILPFLDRIASRDYHFAGTDVVIKKGTAVYIPMLALQNDPQYFPDPEAFKPERFSNDQGHSFPEMAYFPFGAGPRYCIGKRFGVISVKSSLVHLLKDFDVSMTEQSRKPLEYNTRSFTLNLLHGMSLAITPSKQVD